MRKGIQNVVGPEVLPGQYPYHWRHLQNKFSSDARKAGKFLHNTLKQTLHQEEYRAAITLTNNVVAPYMFGVSTPLRYALISGIPGPAAVGAKHTHRTAATMRRRISSVHSSGGYGQSQDLSSLIKLSRLRER